MVTWAMVIIGCRTYNGSIINSTKVSGALDGSSDLSLLTSARVKTCPTFTLPMDFAGSPNDSVVSTGLRTG